MRVLCVFGRFNYGDPKRGEGYEYANFIPSLKKLGHEVLFFDTWDRSQHRNFLELNESLLRTVEQSRPDLILAVQTHYEIWAETWDLISRSGLCATVNWTTDDSWKYAQFSRFLAPFFHAFTTTYASATERYAMDDIPHVFLTQWGASSESLQRPLPAAFCEHRVSFVGTAYGKRRTWIRALRAEGIKVACFGYGWEHGPVQGAKIPALIQNSLISLNFATSPPGVKGLMHRSGNQIKARTFEVPGAGGFLLTEWADALDHYYIPGKEVAVFTNLKELKDKIHYYLSHPDERDAIALAGHARTVKEHTYDQRFSEVLRYAVAQRDEYLARQNTAPTGKIHWDTFKQIAVRHKLDRRLHLLKRFLLIGCSAAWGSARAPRVARRLVFELSWRLAGAHTYTAAGWPGRMFYDVR